MLIFCAMTGGIQINFSNAKFFKLNDFKSDHLELVVFLIGLISISSYFRISHFSEKYIFQKRPFSEVRGSLNFY
jgi:hypothetical protein